MKCFTILLKTGGGITGDFVKCPECGLVVNKTMYEISPECWTRSNNEFHGEYQGTEENLGDLNWMTRIEAQAENLTQLFKLEIFALNGRYVDYGCGDAKLGNNANQNVEVMLSLPMIDIWEKKLP